MCNVHCRCVQSKALWVLAAKGSWRCIATVQLLLRNSSIIFFHLLLGLFTIVYVRALLLFILSVTLNADGSNQYGQMTNLGEFTKDELCLWIALCT